MRNINAQNKSNNVKGGKKLAPMIIAAIVTLTGAAVMLTGCGTDVSTSSLPAAEATVTSSESTTAAASTSAKSAKDENKTSNSTAADSTQISQMSAKTADTNAESAANATAPDHIGVDRATAIANVRELAGSGAQIISCENGTAPDTGFACWVVVVAPVTNGNGPETVTYYSGYQFCYTFEDDSARNATASDGQNPMMNFIGTYTNGRAMMTVSCIGNDQASIHISWGSSAMETSVWDMSGKVEVCNEGIALWYNNCTKQSFKYSEDGTLLSDAIEYENGSGSVDFLSADNNAYWYDAQEGSGAGYSFWFCNE